MTRTKGMRDIPTIQGITRRSQPKTREQTVTELARLEHEQARVERELNIWLENQKQAELRLQKVKERIALLQQALYGPPADRRRASAEDSSGDDSRQEAKTWQKVSLEY